MTKYIIAITLELDGMADGNKDACRKFTTVVESESQEAALKEIDDYLEFAVIPIIYKHREIVEV